MSVATTIQSQIGSRALFMFGAKDLRSLEGKGLSFRVQRNQKRITHVAIYLDPSDTYTVRFLRQHRAPSFRVETVSEESGVYEDQLLSAIEDGTALYASLGTMGKRS